MKTLGIEPEPFAYEIHRCEVYADMGTENHRKLVTRASLGKEIV